MIIKENWYDKDNNYKIVSDDLYKNGIFTDDENEIANNIARKIKPKENIEQAKEIYSLLKQYNVNDLQQLRDLLDNQSNSYVEQNSLLPVTEEILANMGISSLEEWQDAIKRDTLNWEQVCDFGGLNSEVAKQYAIKEVPSNILLSADGKILAKNLKGEQLKKKIEEAVTAAEEKEKQDNKKKK